MRLWFRRVSWVAVGLMVFLLLAAFTTGVYARYELRASLPILNGTVTVSGLGAPVTVERDGLGVPTITAASRTDAARALGFLHAQERFFQMDLQRRQAAGELSALVGARAIDADRSARVHRFRHVAREAIARATPAYRAVIDAYAQGVNAGLRALATPPYEYFLLRIDPDPWQAEDAVLTGLAMFNTLQGRQANFEATFGALADTLPPAMYEFLTARGSEWDTPNVGERFPRPPIPPADVFDLRRGNGQATEAPRHRERILERASFQKNLCDAVSLWPVGLTDAGCLTREEEAGLGSNNWAVAGTHTATGAVLVANDMHLAINVPNIWYRAVMVVPDARAPGQTVRLAGVTLPGLPSVVVGSNGHIAWGFTNTGGDWSDLILLDADARNPDSYLTPEGPQAIDPYTETIAVADSDPVSLDVRWTRWGPIVRRDHKGRAVVQKWVAHDPAVLAADFMALEQARTLEDALHAAATLGIPAQNFVAGDSTGRIGWTIAGPIPRRVGFDGSRPTSWANGSHRWDGYLSPHEYPRIVDPPSGRLWTANSPVVTGDMLATIGEGGYADGIRSRLIRDRLLAIEKATPHDMLSVQLENGALYLERWRTVVLDTLTPAAILGNAARAEFRRLVETTWTGRAEPASVAYRLVRTFRAALVRHVFEALSVPVKRHDPDFDFTRTLRSEGPLWQLVTERPPHLLDPAYPTWDAQIVVAIDTAIAELTEGGRPLAERSWGEFNRAVVMHPLLGTFPVVGPWINMPADALPGDIYTPRAHSPRAGPSERMVVSPGREQEGILHMPTGQSSHPLSPHYADQHRAWVEGKALPFLPGPTVSVLKLTPQ